MSFRAKFATVVAVAAAAATWPAAAAATPASPAPQQLQDAGRWFPAPENISRPLIASGAFDEAARQYAEHFGVSGATARSHLTEQGKMGGLETALRARLGEGFGQLSFDRERGTAKVLLSPSGDEAAARSVLADHGITRPVIGRSAWSAAQLDAAVTELSQRFAAEQRDGDVAIREVADDGIELVVDPKAPAAAVAAARTVAAASGVAPKIVREPVSRGEYAACAGAYCDAPFVAGLRYYNSGGSCSVGFAAYVSGSPALYNLTAGHCISVPNWPNPGRANSTCNAAQTWCGTISNDVGGYNLGIGLADGGVIAHTNSAFPNYPGIRTWGWAFDTYAVRGSGNATLRTWICKSGARTQAVYCGTVTSTNNGGGQFLLDSACTLGGDSGGPIFDPSNLYALGITATVYNTGLDGPCNSTTLTGGEPITRIVSSTGLSGVSTA